MELSATKNNVSGVRKMTNIVILNTTAIQLMIIAVFIINEILFQNLSIL